MKKILAVTSSRADREPLMPIIRALGENCIHEHYENSIAITFPNPEPDIVVFLGDQYRTLLNAAKFANYGIPIAHIHGGEETLASVDNQFRHAITKLALWHFPSCELHAKRIRQMGENPENIFTYGAPGIDALAEPIMTKEECEKELGFEIKIPLALCCYHPETLGMDYFNLSFIEKESENFKTFIISGANADRGGKEINEFWATRKKPHWHVQKTYSQRLWLSLMGYADVLIGNSSGFIIEGLTLQEMRGQKPKICIIGDRQKGRWEEARQQARLWEWPFGMPGTVSKKIAEKLLTVEIPKKPRKIFYVQ